MSSMVENQDTAENSGMLVDAPTSSLATPISTPSLQVQGCLYRCGDCGFVNQLKLQDPIRCRQCGFRVLYKIRTSRMIQFEAR